MLIIDSGSTKADWAFIHDGEVISFQSEGINPLFQTSEDIAEVIKNLPDLLNLQSKVGGIRFYGASCTNEERIGRVEKAFRAFFPNSQMLVTHDLLGAAHATCGNEKGVACILGTGSSAGIYDGISIKRKNRSLGYILGDEGSGAYFGKQFITDYLYGQLPGELADAFGQKHPEINVDYVIDRVYRQPNPNRFLASFMEFIGHYRNNEYCLELLGSGFEKFIRIHVADNPGDFEGKINFVGSVAYFFREELTEAADSLGFDVGKILQRPINGLIAYYKD